MILLLQEVKKKVHICNLISSVSNKRVLEVLKLHVLCKLLRSASRTLKTESSILHDLDWNLRFNHVVFRISDHAVICNRIIV
jgi:hypothetical protein